MSPEDLIPIFGREFLPEEIQQELDGIWGRAYRSKNEGSSRKSKVEISKTLRKSKVKISETLGPKRFKIEFEDIEIELPPRVQLEID